MLTTHINLTSFFTLFKQWNKGFEFFLSPTTIFFVFRQDRMSEAYFILHVGIEKNRFLGACQHLRLDELWVEGNTFLPYPNRITVSVVVFMKEWIGTILVPSQPETDWKGHIIVFCFMFF